MKCNFCGHRFTENEGIKGCSGCPMTVTCNKLKCPHCGYEIPKETRFSKFLMRLLGGRIS